MSSVKQPTSSITDKTIWLIGASSGIGEMLTLRLAEAGNMVIVSARSEDKLEALAKVHPQNISVLATDISKDDDIPAITQRLQAMTDHIDIIIMAAGTVEYEDDLSFDAAMYRRVFDVNFFGMVNAVAIAKPFLEAAPQKGYIVGLSSQSMMIGFSRSQAYGASKAAVDYFLHTLMIDLPQRKYDVSVVRPGFVKTPMTSVNDFPMPFLMSAEEATQRILRGMEKRQRLIVFPKRLSCILRLLSWMPCIWYKYLGPKTSRD
ncbi:MAG: short-subunit dehydrogenase [Candidatus Endobugula sp.]|jgi:short-subunit dehydrogenase